MLLLIDLIIPPRNTALVVRELILADMGQRMLSESEHGGILPYHDPDVRALVWEVKYYANKRAVQLCAAVLAEQLLAVAAETLGTPLLIPIPMHPTRRRERGHNQTEILCEAALPILQQHTSATAALFDYAPWALARVRHTPQQQGLPEYHRRKNVRLSMLAPDPALVRGKICVVVDDVTTTGATFTEATRALKKAGACRVVCIALAQS